MDEPITVTINGIESDVVGDIAETLGTISNTLYRIEDAPPAPTITRRDLFAGLAIAKEEK